MSSTVDIPSGYVGNLDTIQEEKLLDFWRSLMQAWDPNIPPPARKTSISSNGARKSHRRFFSLSRSQAQPTEEDVSNIPANLLSTLKSLGAEATEIKTIQLLLSKLSGDNIRTAYFSTLKQDHPDALLLRFLRAEKWNVPKAWIKLVSALNWRANEYRLEEEVLFKGEGHNLEKSKQAHDSDEKKDGEGFMHQLRTGKGHFHGADRWNRPICIVRVRTHNAADQTQKGLNDYIVQCIETVRLLQVYPVESMVRQHHSAAIVFDLTTFKLSNWDFPPIKFIIGCFQENYPEGLGAMIFYNAPWIFSGFWKIIQGIMDPVVAAKVHFINGAQQLESLIPKSQIIKELGGEEDWEYEYIEPTPNENDRLKDTATRDAILAHRNRIGAELFSITAEWITNARADDSLKSRRGEVIQKLRDNYWELDPYVRARTVLDRTGVIQEGGKIDFYPERTRAQPQASNNEKSVDHVDNTQFTVATA